MSGSRPPGIHFRNLFGGSPTGPEPIPAGSARPRPIQTSVWFQFWTPICCARAIDAVYLLLALVLLVLGAGPYSLDKFLGL